MRYHLVVLHWQSYIIFPGHPQILLLFWGATHFLAPLLMELKQYDRSSGCITSKLNPTQNMIHGTFKRISIFRASALLTPLIFVLKAVEESLRIFHGHRLLCPEVQYSTWELATISFLFWHLDCQIRPPCYMLVWAFSLSTGATEGIKQQGSTSKEFLQGIQTSKELQKINLGRGKKGKKENHKSNSIGTQ